jgi:hypothetical protein
MQPKNIPKIIKKLGQIENQVSRGSKISQKVADFLGSEAAKIPPKKTIEGGLVPGPQTP